MWISQKKNSGFLTDAELAITDFTVAKEDYGFVGIDLTIS